MKPVRLAAALMAVGIVTGCASTANNDALMQEIAAAQATAQTALDAANAANSRSIKANAEAIKAKTAAINATTAAEKAQATADTNRTEFTEMLDRMFKKSMLK
ncbi:MAG: alanine-zipper protein [Pseudomonadota bacterium]